MLYHAYEMTHAAISPMRAAARMGQEVFSNPLNPMAITIGSRAMSAALEMFIKATKRYGKPVFGFDSVTIDGVETPVLVVGAELDGVTGVEAVEVVADCFPHAETAVLPRAGHFPWVDEPEAFVGVVAGFLRRG